MEEKDLVAAGLDFGWERLKEAVGAFARMLTAGKKRDEAKATVEKIEKELSEVLQNLLTLAPDIDQADRVIKASENLPTRPAKLKVVKELREKVAPTPKKPARKPVRKPAKKAAAKGGSGAIVGAVRKPAKKAAPKRAPSRITAGRAIKKVALKKKRTLI